MQALYGNKAQLSKDKWINESTVINLFIWGIHPLPGSNASL
jgi:hypothetical protein